MKIISRSTAFLLSLSLLAMGTSACAQNEYQSIIEIQQSTPARWQETYETKWRTIDIDVAIAVPNVTQFPVIRITQCDPVDESLLAAYDRITENIAGNFYAYMGTPDHTILNNEWIKESLHFYNGEVPDALPENNTLTYPDALSIIADECTRLFGNVELSVEETILQGCVYRFKTVNGKREWVEPVTQKGDYFMILSQGFRGIGYEPSTECYDILRLGNESYMTPSYVCYALYDAQSYLIAAYLHQEADIIYADVPILPFAKAKEAIEMEIMAGHLRGIDELKLCYAPYYDPEDTSILWLLPVWYVNGAYTRSVNRDFTPWTDSTGAVVDSGVEYQEVVYQAQLGTLMAYDDSSRSRRALPKVMTWDDVN